jgi:hypothetical protein
MYFIEIAAPLPKRNESLWKGVWGITFLQKGFPQQNSQFVG